MAKKSLQDALQPGYQLLWYRIGRILGHGAFGITYLAEDVNLARPVAIKEFFPTQSCRRNNNNEIKPISTSAAADFSWGLERFLAEARTLAQFEHPNIIRVINVFEQNGTAYMVMNYETGVSLGTLLKRRRTLDEQTLTRLLLPILDGLEKVHATGFIHRDIKPSNIYLREGGSPVLLDFGSARQSIQEEETQTLTSLVSPGFAPIEQYTSKGERQGPWTDIYGMGATLYRAVTGLLPPSAIDRSEALSNGQADYLNPTRELVAGKYSESFLAAIDHALAFRVQDRPQNVAAWREEFGFDTSDITMVPELSADTATRATVPMSAEARGEASAAGEAEPAAQLSAAAGPEIGDDEIIVLRPDPGEDEIDYAETDDLKDLPRTDSLSLQAIDPSEAETEQAYRTRRPGRRWLHYTIGGGLAVTGGAALVVMTLNGLVDRGLRQLALAEPNLGSLVADTTPQLPEPVTGSAGDINADNAPERNRPAAESPGQQAATSSIATSESVAAALQRRSDPAGVAPDGDANPQPSQTEAGQADIDTLLAAARNDFEARRLTTPPGNNAHEKYRAVLAQDPGNTAAREGLREIHELYLMIAENSARQGDFSHAEEMLRRAAIIDDDSPALLDAQTRLERQRSATRTRPLQRTTNRPPPSPPLPITDEELRRRMGGG